MGEESEDPYAAQDEWPWEDEDDYDPELVELGDARARDTVLRPILMVLVLVMGAYIISDWQEELEYFFSSDDPVEIGNVTDFPDKRAEDPNWSPDIPHNRYVSVSGIGHRRSIGKRHKYFRLIGGEIYVEQERADADMDELERIERGAPKGDRDYSRFIGEGRALSFSAMPERYAGLRRYYSKTYGVTFCVDMDEGTRRQILQNRREIIRKMWRQNWEEASPEVRERKGLEPEPSEAKIKELLDETPVCVDAWLVQANHTPSDHWWYVVLTALFGIFMLVDVVFLVRWFIRFLKPSDSDL